MTRIMVAVMAFLFANSPALAHTDPAAHAHVGEAVIFGIPLPVILAAGGLAVIAGFAAGMRLLARNRSRRDDPR